MILFSKEEALAILKKVLSYSTADECEANLDANLNGNIRFARNSVSTSGALINQNLAVTCAYGKKTGVATIDEFDEESIKRVVKRAEELAKLAPENPEYMPRLTPQQYDEPNAYNEATAGISPDYRAEVAGTAIKECEAQQLVGAGFFEHSTYTSAMMNSKGLFAYHRGTDAKYNLTVRNQAGTGSGYANASVGDIRQFDAKATSLRAAKKAAMSAGAVALEPGKYTVILEPLAASELIERMTFNMDMRTTDEGRSFLVKPGGGNKLNEKIVDERVTLYSDPMDASLPSRAWDGEGMPIKRTTWIENGVVKNLLTERYWAQKTGKQPLPFPSNLLMKGTEKSLEDLIAGTDRGILVTRFWYIRDVDPQTVLLTGLTRDGTFLVENGKIKHAIKNFRYNESPIIMLNNILDMGRPERVLAEESGRTYMIPPLKVRDFTFSSLSDAV